MKDRNLIMLAKSYMYVCKHACMHACKYACVYACMHVCMYVCIARARCECQMAVGSGGLNAC